MVKHFVGNKTHFLAFANNLYKDDVCVYIMDAQQLDRVYNVYLVAGEMLPDELYTVVMYLYLEGLLNIKVLPESLLYSKIN